MPSFVGRQKIDATEFLIRPNPSSFWDTHRTCPILQARILHRALERLLIGVVTFLPFVLSSQTLESTGLPLTRSGTTASSSGEGGAMVGCSALAGPLTTVQHFCMAGYGVSSTRLRRWAKRPEVMQDANKFPMLPMPRQESNWRCISITCCLLLAKPAIARFAHNQRSHCLGMFCALHTAASIYKTRTRPSLCVYICTIYSKASHVSLNLKAVTLSLLLLGTVRKKANT